MPDANDAYREAQRLIAEAAASGATKLDLGTPKTRALTTLPPKIGGLTTLTFLDLSSTQVTDLTPLVRLTALNTLYLSETPITDLTPLAQLTALTALNLAGARVTDLAPLSELIALVELDVSGTEVTNLVPLSRLTALNMLDLSFNLVADLVPLTQLTALTMLDLGFTQVADPRPLIALTKLATAPRFGGLNFHVTPFASLPEFAGIAEIEDPAERAQRLFAALEGWVPQGEVTAAAKPDEDDLLPVILINGQIEVSASVATEAERQNQANRILHDRLLAKAKALALAAGNQFPDLSERARSVLDLLDRPFEQVNLFSVHLELEDLEDRRKMGLEDDLPFTAKVKLALSDVTRNGPGLTLGHPQVELLLERRRMARDAPVSEIEEKAHAGLGQIVIDDSAAHGPNLRRIEQEADSILDRKVSLAVRKAMHRNYLIKIGALAGLFTVGMTENILATRFGDDIWVFVTGNFSTLQAVAQTYGMAFATWFGQATDAVAQVIAANATIEPRPLPRKKK